MKTATVGLMAFGLTLAGCAPIYTSHSAKIRTVERDEIVLHRPDVLGAKADVGVDAITFELSVVNQCQKGERHKYEETVTTEKSLDWNSTGRKAALAAGAGLLAANYLTLLLHADDAAGSPNPTFTERWTQPLALGLVLGAPAVYTATQLTRTLPVTHAPEIREESRAVGEVYACGKEVPVGRTATLSFGKTRTATIGSGEVDEHGKASIALPDEARKALFGNPAQPFSISVGDMVATGILPESTDRQFQLAKMQYEKWRAKCVDRQARARQRNYNAPLRCRDGSLSPGCTCGGPRRGCCSRHGGVLGCSGNTPVPECD
jgi:hypothetical protein